MNAWNPAAVRMFIPALIGWCLALAACLRAEQLHGDLHAQALLPVLQRGARCCSVWPARLRPACCCGGMAAVIVGVSLPARCQRGIHQHAPAWRALEGTDLRQRPLEMPAGAVDVQGSAAGMRRHPGRQRNTASY